MNICIHCKEFTIKNILYLIVGLVLFGCQQTAQDPDLEAGFENPPSSAKPRVWWHWMNGNISKEGIKADLEWMNRIGIGGFQNFDAGLSTPQVVEQRLSFMTPEWKDAFLYATTLADSLGLEMAIAGSPGWSESGGPWVPPSQGMKKYVWSETHVEGGQPFTGLLPKPPTTTGTFQNVPLDRFFGVAEEASPPPEFYEDVAVVAFRAPARDVPLTVLQPIITSSGGQFELVALTDGDLAHSTLLPAAPAGEKAWIQFEFEQPETFRSLTIVGGGGGGEFSFLFNNEITRTLEASDDGIAFRTVVTIPGGGVAQKTMTFPPTTSKYFRFTFMTPPPQPGAGGLLSSLGLDAPPAPSGTQIAELVLHTETRVNRFEEKAAFSAATDLAMLATPAAETSDTIDRADVIDLTSILQPDGAFDWTPPDGQWIVMRLGYSLTGRQNHPASPEATGLEVDKLDPDAVKAYFDNYLDQYQEATGGLMGERGLQYVITDSWEAGVQNWTGNMMAEFSGRRGYDLLPYLPVLTGRIVESAEASDRFLWDFRKTIGELTAEYHYDQLTEILNERGMGRYTESHEGGRAFIGDGMEVKRSADVPMSATWTPGGFGRDPSAGVATQYKADVRESASVAHLFGQNLVAAESMTAIGTAWAWSPELLKPTADMELAMGLNRFIIHTSVHQPVSDKIPGLGLGPFGQWFTRHETWAEQAKPWITYLARSSFILQQGTFVADIIYYYGEDSNITALFGEELPDIPDGYNYDFVNADALVNLLSVENGRITSPSGMHYRVLVLDPNSRQMSLPVLRKIRQLVNDGAVVVGPKPTDTPSLSDDRMEFQTLSDELWGTGTDKNTVGKGSVFSGQTLAQVLSTLNMRADFTYTKPKSDTELLFVHRRLADTEIYWVNNRNDRVEHLDATFRVEGKAAEVWHPVTGRMDHVSFTVVNEHTIVPLHLEPDDALFVVFREDTDETSRTVVRPVETQLALIGGPWAVHFQSDRGAPEQIEMEALISWSDHADAGVRYFSGTARYSVTVQASADWFQSDIELWLDLGDIKNLTEVHVNGVSSGIVWKKPFRTRVTESLRPGENILEVDVTNLWVNRLIGDQQPGVTETYTYTTQQFYRADAPLLPSGLLGPVQIVCISAN